MKLLRHDKILLLLAAVLIDGCAVGYNTTLFTTRSNIGIDVDTKPPVAEMSISRQEGVLAPSFEGGQTPPVIANFQTHSDPFSSFFFGVKSTFAGGDAAVGLTKESSGATAAGVANDSTGDPVSNASGICLSTEPKPTPFFWGWFEVSIPKAGEVKPFFFTTDTNFGLKLAWSGMAGPFPDTIRLGFHRNELALAPVYGTVLTKPPVDHVPLVKPEATAKLKAPAKMEVPTINQTCRISGTNKVGHYVVWMPSFLAVLDNDVQTGLPQDTGLKWRQYFATGKSATALANNPIVRESMQSEVYPETTGTIDNSDPTNVCVRTWLNADPNNPDILVKWWDNNPYAAIDIYYPANKQKRADFIREKNIPCK